MAKKKKKVAKTAKLKVVEGGAAKASRAADPENTPIVPPPEIPPVEARPAPIGQVEPSTGERRLWRRVPFFRKIQYKFETMEQFRSEFANDISLGGMFIK